jgi:hypothetical protein
LRDLSDRKSKTVQMAGDFGEIVKFGGSAEGRPPQPPNLDKVDTNRKA